MEGLQIRSEEQWESLVKGVIKSELKKREKTYGYLARRLEKIGVIESEQNIKNKLSRGRFSAIFFLQCLIAIEVPYLHVDEFYTQRSKPPRFN